MTPGARTSAVSAKVGFDPLGRVAVCLQFLGPSPYWVTMQAASARQVAALLLNVADEADAVTARGGAPDGP